MYIVKITNNTPLCKMVNFSRSVLKIYTGQKKFTRAAPVAPVTNIRYGVKVDVEYLQSVIPDAT